MGKQSLQPLYQPFNDAVLLIARRLMPNGFDVYESAPDTLAGATWHYRHFGRIGIWSGASDQTIFGDPAVNHAFRAWHDWHHVNLQAEFTADGERRVLQAQQADLWRYWYFADLTPWEYYEYHAARMLLDAEVAGQLAYQATHRDFPVDQRAFALAYILNPVSALQRTF